MSAAQKILAKLQGVKKNGKNRWKALCPVHEERTPSLYVTDTGDGRVLIHCFGCAANGLSVVESLGLSAGDLFDHPLTKTSLPARRSGLSSFDCLAAMRREVDVVRLLASDISKGTISQADKDRAMVAAERIEAALSLCDG